MSSQNKGFIDREAFFVLSPRWGEHVGMLRPDYLWQSYVNEFVRVQRLNRVFSRELASDCPIAVMRRPTSAALFCTTTPIQG